MKAQWTLWSKHQYSFAIPCDSLLPSLFGNLLVAETVRLSDHVEKYEPARVLEACQDSQAGNLKHKRFM